jgi:hypothetical protein
MAQRTVGIAQGAAIPRLRGERVKTTQSCAPELKPIHPEGVGRIML